MNDLPATSVRRLRAVAVVAVFGVVAVIGALVVTARGNGAGTQVRFTASGDFAATAATDGVLRSVAAQTPQLHLALGDLSYGVTGQEQSWCDFVTQRVGAGFPFELLAGNHESNGQNGNINDFSACLPNQLPGAVGTYGRRWYVDVPASAPQARFVMVSPGISYPTGFASYANGTADLSWTADAIDQARAAGIDWVIVGAHMPCLSVGDYGCSSGADFTNLMLAKRVDLVLHGHEHLYQRTSQLGHAAGCATITPGIYTAACVRDADDSLVKGAGTVFVTVGTGGVALRNVTLTDPEAPYFRAVSGLNQSPSHGSLSVQLDDDTLSANFVPSSGSFIDAFQIARPAGNQPPVASIAAPSCTGLTCSFSGVSSVDPDGTVTSWAWEFGDGGTATGATATRTYAAPGTYLVRLRVTDNGGLTNETTRSVTVSAAAPTLAADSFGRTVTSGWGTADTGGTWSTSGTTSVAAGVGRLTMSTPGSGASAALPVSSASTDVVSTVTVDRAGGGGGGGTTLITRGRVVGSAGDYRSKLTWRSTNQLWISLARTGSTGAETALGSVVTLPGTFAAGELVKVRTQVTGANPTTVRARVWRALDAEPTTWQVQITDSTLALQSAGTFRLQGYLSSSATTTPVTITVDDLRITAP